MKFLFVFTFNVMYIGLLMPHDAECVFGSFGKSAFDTGVGIIKKVPDVLPSPDALFQLSKNALVGYPFDVGFKVINSFCSAAVSVDQVKPKVTPDVKNMNFILRIENEDHLFALTQPELLWNDGKFNRNHSLVVFVTGWTTNYNESENSALDLIYDAYRCRGNVNFVTVDTAAYVDTLYSWSALNTDVIGEKIGEALATLTTTYPCDNIHLIGHSLGAHIVGSAGRTYAEKTGKLLPHITGLDPANPCFNEGESLSGLNRGDAVFVDVIHSNCGALGKRDSLGDLDFYPNGLDPLPPGCFTISCAHMRAWEYYAETVYPGNEENFMGIRCTSLTALNTNQCRGNSYPMGYATPHTLKGNYFLSTNSDRPYGRNVREGRKLGC